MRFQLVFIVIVTYFSEATDLLDNKISRFFVTCHTTDFECYKIQYQYLRDKVLMGNPKLSIPKYKNFMFKYGPSTCIRLSGLEHSVLTGVQMNSNSMEYTWTLQMPFLIQQINVNQTRACANPDSEFRNIPPRRGALKKFRGNATISVSYPYALKKRNGEVHMILNDENLDVVLDIPDLSHYNHDSQFENINQDENPDLVREFPDSDEPIPEDSNLYELSEWAYDVVQHIDAAQHFALPYTTQLRTVMQQTPLSKFLLLYPDQSYMDISFNLTEKLCHCPPGEKE